MPKIDLNAPLYTLLFPAIRANAAPLLSTSIMLTAANLAPELVPMPDGQATPEAFELATIVVVMLAWVLAETSIAFAIYPTLLTGGVLRGYEALRRAAFPRLALFVAMQFMLMLAMLVLFVLIVGSVAAFGHPDVEGLIDDPTYPILSATSLLAVFLIGLTQPDIVLTGRLSLVSAIRWAWRARLPLALGLIAGAGPFWWAAEAVTSWADAEGPSFTGAGEVTLRFVVLTYLSVFLSMLGSVLAAITLAKTYRAVLPPDALLEAGRVSEVFD
ncbi:MAG: hypothetical protein AB8B85_20300 [Paracoccaceae bacterium]